MKHDIRYVVQNFSYESIWDRVTLKHQTHHRRLSLWSAAWFPRKKFPHPEARWTWSPSEAHVPVFQYEAVEKGPDFWLPAPVGWFWSFQLPHSRVKSEPTGRDIYSYNDIPWSPPIPSSIFFFPCSWRKMENFKGTKFRKFQVSTSCSKRPDW